MADAPSRPTGIRLIILYKALKAIAEALLAVGLILFAGSEVDAIRNFVATLRGHFESRWSAAFASVLEKLGTRKGLHLVSAGLAADAVITAFEGWSLWKGYAWGPWLVVLATGTPIPLEIREILRAPRPARIVVTAINVAVVLYLARRIAVQRRERRGIVESR